MAGRRWMTATGLAFAAMALVACSETPANEFEAGECTDDSLSGVIADIETVDCDEDHQAEAYAQFDVEGDEFPGEEALTEEVQEGCLGDRFADYVGVSYDQSIYLADGIKPSEESWEGGDRTVICVIGGTTDGSPLEGSAEGTER